MEIDVDELIEDLTETFGDDRVFYIDENTDFSKLPNPFVDNSKNKKESIMRPRKIPMQVRINEDLASQIKKVIPIWQESVGWKVSQQKFVEQACYEFILKLKDKAETEKEE
jgi:bisphosphoglycerate-dependent phosphoglycerate mutase